MDVHERLTFEESVAPTSMASEHVQRYEFAARFCEGQKVLDLCCGSGYGSEILAQAGTVVTGVDRDGPTVDAANARVRGREDVTFVLGDAVTYLTAHAGDFETIVCFEGLEHLDRLEEALALLVAFAENGGRVIASVPNSRTFSEENPFHLTDFDPDLAMQAFSRFPDHVILTQHMVEGGLIAVPDGDGVDTRLTNPERAEFDYATHYLLFSNCDCDEINRADWRVFLTAAPLHIRYLRGVETANQELRRINARLSRTLLGSSAAAAAKRTSKVNARVVALETEIEELQRRVRDERERGDVEYQGRRDAEARIQQLESIFRAGPLEAAATARRWRT